MENIFSSKELDTLIEALESWEKKDNAGRLMGSLFGSMLMKDNSEAKIEWERKEREEEEKNEQGTTTAERGIHSVKSKNYHVASICRNQ